MKSKHDFRVSIRCVRYWARKIAGGASGRMYSWEEIYWWGGSRGNALHRRFTFVSVRLYVCTHSFD
eukprot:1393816-Amorphochlora_amoeboformis.AAC.1